MSLNFYVKWSNGAHSSEQCDQHSSSHKRVATYTHTVVCSPTGTAPRYRMLHYRWMVKVENRITSLKADKPSLRAVCVAAQGGGEHVTAEYRLKCVVCVQTNECRRHSRQCSSYLYTANQTRSACDDNEKKKLIRRWDSERELFYGNILHVYKVKQTRA